MSARWDSQAPTITSHKRDGLQATTGPMRALGPKARKPSRQYGTGRSCETCGCDLSRYNPDDTCAPCAPPSHLTGGPTRRKAAA